MIDLLIGLVVLVVILLIAKWIIDQFFPEPIRMVALVIVGLLAFLIVLKELGVGGSWGLY